MVGKTVQHYQFLERLGAGGMGEIYRAQDTRLNRFVAIKVLTGSGSNDPERRRRFIQEAQAASALNHPNIITIHDILTDAESQYMVMEHVQGKTLAELIPKGGLRLPQVLKFAMQMTDALQTAHAAGIIHRDLKPGNIMVTESGLVKVLDFGLAKLAEPAPITQDDATRTIADAPLTMEGSIIGTVAYMSPEQAQGKKVDTRSDIFSLGVVLYEMITGNRAFQGDSTVATLTAILRDEARPMAENAPDVPPRLEDVVAKSLKKNPDDRFQTMKEMHMALGALKHESDSGVLYRSQVMTQAMPAGKAPEKAAAAAASSEGGSNKKVLIGVGAAVLVAAIGGVAWMQLNKQPEPAPVAEAPAQAPAPAPAPEPVIEKLNNDGIIEMVKAKLPTEVILSQIRSAPTDFNLSATEVIRLTKAGVALNIIEGMRDPKSIPPQKLTAKAVEMAKAVLPNMANTSKAASATSAPQTSATPSAPEPQQTQQQHEAAPQEHGNAPAAPEPAQAKAAANHVVLPDGSPFPVTLSIDVPEDAKPGFAMHFVVKNDVKIGNDIVIHKGAPVTGEVTQPKRTFGKMQMKLTSVVGADGKTYKIRALSARSNKNQERQVDTGAKTPNKIQATTGTDYIAYADGDLSIGVGH